MIESKESIDKIDLCGRIVIVDNHWLGLQQCIGMSQMLNVNQNICTQNTKGIKK